MSIHPVSGKSVHTKSNTSDAGISARVLAMASLALFCVGVSPAWALDRMGSPTVHLGEGRISVGVDYAWSQTDLKADGSSLYTYSELSFGGWIVKQRYQSHRFTMRDVDIHRLYATVGYGLGSRSDVFFRLGAAQVDWNADGGARPAASAGIRTTFHESGPLQIGGLAQIGWTDARYDAVVVPGVPGAYPETMDAELSLWEIQLAATARYRLAGNLSVYGGPFLYFATGTLDAENMNLPGSPIPELRPISLENSYDVEQTTCFGGHVGLTAEVTELITFDVEYQHTGDADAVTAGLICQVK